MASLSPIKTAGMVVDLATHPALTDGGQSSVRNLLSKLPAGATLAGFFEVS
jgi:hypothetical protein